MYQKQNSNCTPVHPHACGEQNSIVSEGCIISGGSVKNSTLSPKARVHSFADVSNSILMDNMEIGEYAKVKNAIVEHSVTVPQGLNIGYNIEEDKKHFYVSRSGIVVVTKDSIQNYK